MECSVFSFQGKFHNNCSITCEDKYVVFKTNSVAGIIICDGAGTMSAGGEAAMITATVVAGILEHNFEKIMYDEQQNVKRMFAHHINSRLLEYSISRGISEKELACTVLAVAVDIRGRCICLHLGDGIIIQKRSTSQRQEIVSLPMWGIGGGTFLTMNCNMCKYLQLYRWEDDQIEKILLMTDGAAEHLLEEGRILQQNAILRCPMDIKIIQSYLEKCNPNDDCSCGMVEINC